MNRVRDLEGPILVGTIWLVLALAELWLRDTGRAVLLIWLPSAVAVAALHGNPFRRWPGILAGLAVAQVTMAMLIGFPLVAGLGSAFASATEATLCTWIGMRVPGGRGRIPSSLHDVAGLFGAAVAGAAMSALIV